jgi:hypothetical protein
MKDLSSTAREKVGSISMIVNTEKKSKKPSKNPGDVQARAGDTKGAT